jgi:hypothetical protein
VDLGNTCFHPSIGYTISVPHRNIVGFSRILGIFQISSGLAVDFYTGRFAAGATFCTANEHSGALTGRHRLHSAPFISLLAACFRSPTSPKWPADIPTR